MTNRKGTEDLTNEDLLGMSDDEILGMAEPPKLAAAPAGASAEGDTEEDASEAAEPDKGEDGGKAEGEGDGEAATADKDAAPEADADPAPEDAEPEAPDPTAAKPKAKPSEVSPQTAPKPAAGTEAQKEEAKPDAQATKPEGVDYKAIYDRIMSPFKANGKMVKVDGPDDVIQLMQMGANYTKKIQALQPGLKVLRMLENHGLLDETKLSFLIDLHRKDPGAVKKMVKDSGVDPLDIDTSKDPGYKPGDYRVSDQEVAFVDAIREVGSDQGGRELVRTIQQSWDKGSKDAILKDPDILRVVNEQRINGIFGQINAEIERRKTLGRIRPNTPFLEAYRTVGEEMQQSGALLVQSGTTPQPAAPNSGAKPAQKTGSSSSQTGNRRTVDQRPAQRKPSDTRDVSDRIRAASPTPSSAAKAPPKEFNPLSLSDEDFEKAAAAGRRF